MPNYFDTSTKIEATRRKTFRSIENPYKLGEKGSHTRKLGVLQDFDVLKEKHSSSNLFIDNEFPADESSINLPELVGRADKDRDFAASKKVYQWLRPKEILLRQKSEKSPKFFVNGSARFDVEQQSLADCWFLASLAEVSEHPNLLSRVVPQCQGYFNDCGQATNSVVPLKTDCRVFDEDNYAGIFHFRFWQFGSWVDVVIDDFLPIHDNGELVFATSSSKDEFWCALVEKAYAKLRGCYAALNYGKSSQALRDLTGGICCIHEFSEQDFNLKKKLTEAQKRNALVTFSSLKGEDDSGRNTETYGIIRKHVYSLTEFFPKEEKKWLKLRNPWGCGEWNGVGSDKWMEDCDDEKLKERLGFKFSVDGEFSIPLKQAKTYFRRVFICYINSDPSEASRFTNDTKTWQLSQGPEVTVSQGSSGYRVTLGTPSKKNATKYEVIVELTQSTLQSKSKDIPRIGFRVYELNSDSSRMVHERELCWYITTSSHLKLQSGTYRIEPITPKSIKPTKFLLRVLCNGPVTIEFELRLYTEERRADQLWKAYNKYCSSSMNYTNFK